MTELQSTCPSELLDGKKNFETKSFFVSSGISAKFFLENCQKPVGDVLRVRRENFDEKQWKHLFPTIFWTSRQTSLVSCQNVSDRLFRTPFYVSMGTVWRKTIFFEKIKNFQSNSVHSKRNLSPYNEKNGGFIRTRFYVSVGTVRQNFFFKKFSCFFNFFFGPWAKNLGTSRGFCRSGFLRVHKNIFREIFFVFSYFSFNCGPSPRKNRILAKTFGSVANAPS